MCFCISPSSDRGVCAPVLVLCASLGLTVFVSGLCVSSGKNTHYHNTSLLKIDGVTDRKETGFYLGKRVAYIYKVRCGRDDDGVVVVVVVAATHAWQHAWRHVPKRGRVLQ